MREPKNQIETFRLLRGAAETGIADAKTIKDMFDGAVNWADLRCVRVYRWMDDSGDSGYTVEIEEADPGANELRRFITDSIEEDTGISVEVITEW